MSPSNELGLTLLRLLTAAFLAVIFLQSGIDKVADRKGNLKWLTGHFAKTPFRKQVPLLLWAITGLELLAGGLSALGVLQLLVGAGAALAFWGAAVSCVALLSLFAGQRLAKDYVGAAVLVPYFLVGLAGSWLSLP